MRGVTTHPSPTHKRKNRAGAVADADLTRRVWPDALSSRTRTADCPVGCLGLAAARVAAERARDRLPSKCRRASGRRCPSPSPSEPCRADLPPRARRPQLVDQIFFSPAAIAAKHDVIMSGHCEDVTRGSLASGRWYLRRRRPMQ